MNINDEINVQERRELSQRMMINRTVMEWKTVKPFFGGSPNNYSNNKFLQKRIIQCKNSVSTIIGPPVERANAMNK